ncbi:LPXTG-motif cell wall-anchored protein, partial [Breznakia blatticola]
FMHLSFTDDTFTMEAYRTDTLETVDSYTIKKTADTPVVEKPVDEKPAVDTPKDNTVSKPATSPDTGDSTTPMVFALMLLASGMVLGAYKLKRKN